MREIRDSSSWIEQLLRKRELLLELLYSPLFVNLEFIQNNLSSSPNVRSHFHNEFQFKVQLFLKKNPRT